MAKTAKIRKIVREEFKCPYCKERCTVSVANRTIKPAVPAVKEIEVTVEKYVQTKLGD